MPDENEARSARNLSECPYSLEMIDAIKNGMLLRMIQG